MRTAFILLLLAILSTSTLGCAPRNTAPYPRDSTLDLAALQQREYVDSFLQGYWCAADALLAMSLDNSTREDDFCQAAQTAHLGVRLRAYIGASAPELEKQADQYRRMGMGCPDLDLGPSERDRTFQGLVDAGAFDDLARLLQGEDDSLFTSVYARKGARAAMAGGNTEAALRLIEVARARDARQGWVVFLREDWLLRRELESNPEAKRAINERIRSFEQRIVSCD